MIDTSKNPDKMSERELRNEVKERRDRDNDCRAAWEILEEHLPDDAGYEGDEVEECAEYVKEYNDAFDTIRKSLEQ